MNEENATARAAGTLAGARAPAFFRGAVHGLLSRIAEGRLTLSDAWGTVTFGDPTARLAAEVSVHDARAYRKAVLGGDVGFAEGYIDGAWSSPDLARVTRLAVRNPKAFNAGASATAFVSTLANRVLHVFNRNTESGSRRNISAHYDLGNDFYRLFLDEQLVYSAAVFQAPGTSLEAAQVEKLDRICRKLRLGPGHHVLEIGTGWGAFAIHAAKRTGCRVTTTTISPSQYAHAKARIAEEGLEDRVTLLLEDYRKLTGTFNRLVSIEMFEAVGFANYDTFFRAADRLLAPGGSMLLQTITLPEQRFAAYRKQPDVIQTHVFPGAELASLSGIARSLARVSDLTILDLEDIGLHYARTLRIWRERFHARLREVRAQGFDERFVRLWDYYLAYCEGAFAERAIGDAQLVLVKNLAAAPLLDELPPGGESLS